MDKYEYFIEGNKDRLNGLIVDLLKKVDYKSNAFMPYYRSNGFIDYSKGGEKPDEYLYFHRHHDDKNNVYSSGVNTVTLNNSKPIINFEAVSQIMNEFGLSRDDCNIIIDYLEKSDNLRIYNRKKDPYKYNEFGEIERTSDGFPIRVPYVYDAVKCSSPEGEYAPLLSMPYDDKLNGRRWRKYFYPEYRAEVVGSNVPSDKYFVDVSGGKFNYSRFRGHRDLQNHWYPLDDENADIDIPKMADMIIKFLNKYCDKHKVAIFIASLMLSGDMNVREILGVKDKAISLSERFINYFCETNGNCNEYDFNDFLRYNDNKKNKKINYSYNSSNSNNKGYNLDYSNNSRYYCSEENPEYMSSHLGVDYYDRDEDDDSEYDRYIKESIDDYVYGNSSYEDDDMPEEEFSEKDFEACGTNTPDDVTLLVKGDYLDLHFDDRNAHAFFIYGNKVISGGVGSTHLGIARSFTDKMAIKYFNGDKKDTNLGNWFCNNAFCFGRIWLNIGNIGFNVISVWDTTGRDMADNLNLKYNSNISNKYPSFSERKKALEDDETNDWYEVMYNVNSKNDYSSSMNLVCQHFGVDASKTILAVGKSINIINGSNKLNIELSDEEKKQMDRQKQIHLMKQAEKRKALQAYRDTKEKKLGDKLSYRDREGNKTGREMTDAEWRFRTSMDESISLKKLVRIISESINNKLLFEKRIRKNDEGKVVPNKCPECGSDIVVKIEGEPVYLCSNKKCNKYFGVVPFNE